LILPVLVKLSATFRNELIFYKNTDLIPLAGNILEML